MTDNQKGKKKEEGRMEVVDVEESDDDGDLFAQSYKGGSRRC